VIDGDAAGHQVLQILSIKQQIRKRFGDSVFNEQADVVRAELGRRIFGSAPEQSQARADLEEIVHPKIRELFVEQIADARKGNNADAVILDAAVLFEADWHDLCRRVVFVDAPRRVRLARVIQTRGWTEREFHDKELSQLPPQDKCERADFIVDNSGTIDEAAAQLEQIVSQIIDHRS